MTEFVKWPSITRLANETMIVSEKLDGTSCAIQFQPRPDEQVNAESWMAKTYNLSAQSRNRFITPDDDNYGFARWAYDNQESLFADLGYGVHHGEWWGQGIQRKYGMDRKVFSLFNTRRAGQEFTTPNLDVVPVLATVNDVSAPVMVWHYDMLRQLGSYATEKYTGQKFANPEGVVALLIGTGARYKINDAPVTGKGPKDEHGNAGG